MKSISARALLSAGLARVAIRCARLAIALCLALAPLALAGCYDMEYKLSIRDDGTTAVDIDLRSDADMAEIFGIFEAFSELGPQAAALKDGVCNAMPQLAALNPAAQTYNLRGKQGLSTGEGGKFFCTIGADVGTIGKLAELATQDPTGAVVVKESGPKTYTVTIDLSAVPAIDTAEVIKMGLLAQSGQLAGPGRDPPRPEVISDIADKSVAALLSINRIIMRGRHVDLAISGRRIVETNGQVSPDGKTARFRLTAEEFMGILMKGDARQGKKFHAVVEY
jgi:hypothetical protein